MAEVKIDEYYSRGLGFISLASGAFCMVVLLASARPLGPMHQRVILGSAGVCVVALLVGILEWTSQLGYGRQMLIFYGVMALVGVLAFLRGW